MRRAPQTAAGISFQYAVLLSIAIGLPASATSAESVPASIRACTLEPDSLKRLICFDRELARFGNPAPADAPRAPGEVARAPAPSATNQSAPAAVTSIPAVTAAGSPAATTAAGADPASKPARPKHITARITLIEEFPDALVVHLDNEQVWEQVQPAAADLNLHKGDAITIDRELGSYWLAAADGTAMKVKQRK